MVIWGIDFPMSYEVIARKWRPQQFDDVVGQDHVVRTLRNAIESDRLAHAYLFVGPRGIGKTSIARIFAKALNCETGPTVTPCDACDICREITAGNSLDVLEIDGASNNGVEQVRELRDTIQYAPAHGRFKLIIIDEVHMLSTPAFNALLKTLEEPPAHVKFMFATTEPQKIPATIISRCQRFDLRRIPTTEIVERLRLIAKDEKVKADEDALLAIARGSEGALRDAESALDQLISFKGKTIAEEDVLSVFGLVAHSTLQALSSSILGGDLAAVIGMVDDLEQKGKDLQRLVLELMDHFRNLLVSLQLPGGTALRDLTEAQLADLKQQAGGADTGRLLRITDILSETEERMRFSLSKRILLETALVRCARAAAVATLEDLLAQVESMKGGGAESAPAGPPAEKKKVAAAAAPAAPAPAEPAPEQAAPDAGGDVERLGQRWDQVVARAGRIAVAVKGALKDSCPVSVTADVVRVALDPEFASEMALFEQPRNRNAVERALSVVLDRAVTATFEVWKAQPVAAGVAPDEPAAAGTPEAESPSPCTPGEPPGPGGILAAQAWKKRPEVQKVLDVFNGTIVDVRE